MSTNYRKTATNPPGVATPLRPYYSNSVTVTPGPMLYISGQVSWDEDGSVVGVGDATAQTRKVFENIETILSAHGATFADIVKVTVYVTSFDFFDEVAAIRNAIFVQDPPASAIVQVVRLVDPQLMIEIDAVAVLPE